MRASFLWVILKIFEERNRVCTEEKKTASREVIFVRKRWIEMLWILIGLGVSLVAVFMLLQFAAAKQMEQDMALILAEYPSVKQSVTPSTKASDKEVAGIGLC